MEKVNEFDAQKRREDMFNRKAKKVGQIIVESAEVQINNPNTYAFVLGTVLTRSIFSRGGLKSSIETGLSVFGGVVVAGVVYNLVESVDEIREA